MIYCVKCFWEVTKYGQGIFVSRVFLLVASAQWFRKCSIGCIVECLARNPYWCRYKISLLLINPINVLHIILSSNFENAGNRLTGLYFFIKVLPPALKIGMTWAMFISWGVSNDLFIIWVIGCIKCLIDCMLSCPELNLA